MDEEEQLSLFDTEERILPELPSALQIGEHVQIYIPEHKVKDPESFFYLQDFIKKRGVVVKVVEQLKLQYEVEVGNRIAFVYHDELKIGWP